jgi:phospholipase C
MRNAAWSLLLVLVGFSGDPAQAQISSFQHIVVIFQENRTPDNLFQGLCSAPWGTCGTGLNQYNIQTSSWLDKTASGGVTQPLTVPLANKYDLSHKHSAFTAQCDVNGAGVCQMDGAASVTCKGACLSQPQYRYVDNSARILDPYLELATQYGWANFMFQTNQGPSFPAHQFIFGGTSAPSAADDAMGIFAAENPGPLGAGCTAPPQKRVQLLTPAGENPKNTIYPCFEHGTVPDILPAGVSWKYYSPNATGIWTAPNAISHICGPSDGMCLGWGNNVDLTPKHALKDISTNCELAGVTWIIPTGQNSDHADDNNGGGPSWVASLVNAIGNSKCKNPDGSSYWASTAIFIAWDDWGGWYDHEAPVVLSQPEGDYQYGFRVPLIVVSAYTPAAYIDNTRYDFGSILRYIELNFGIPNGALNFADARSANDLSDFFILSHAARPFVTINASKDAEYFLNDQSPPTDPDDD